MAITWWMKVKIVTVDQPVILTTMASVGTTPAAWAATAPWPQMSSAGKVTAVVYLLVSI